MSESSSSSSKIAVLGVILTAITIIIGVYNHNRDEQLAKEKAIQEQKLRYNEMVDNFLIDVNKLVSQSKQVTTISINNKTDKRLSLAIQYLSLNGIWVTEGYMNSPANSVSVFTSHTANTLIYVYSATHDIRNLIFNSEPIKDSISGYIVPKERFFIINSDTPPFELKKVNFYRVKLSADITLNVEN
jgi:hypothetical protein